jgi:hypothetical protein
MRNLLVHELESVKTKGIFNYNEEKQDEKQETSSDSEAEEEAEDDALADFTPSPRKPS